MAEQSYYKLHARHDAVTIHITRDEARKLIAGVSRELSKRRARGHREFFVLTAHKARIWHKLTITHCEAHRRHVARRVDDSFAKRNWVAE